MPTKKIIGVGTPRTGWLMAMAPKVSWVSARPNARSMRAILTARAFRPSSGRTVVKAVNTR